MNESTSKSDEQQRPPAPPKEIKPDTITRERESDGEPIVTGEIREE